MQTFLPYRDFNKTAKVLDDRRLNKQLVECQQILKALSGKTKGWVSHPVTRMWKGHRGCLYSYMLSLEQERRRRAEMKQTPYKPHGSLLYVIYYMSVEIVNENSEPAWLGLEELHSSYRANLLRKDPEWYGQYGWEENPSSGYPYQQALEAMTKVGQ